jgi:hypothetical protein
MTDDQNVIATLLRFKMGDHVIKHGEDSIFEGYIVAAFVKLNGKTVRYVVENDDGVLHIASEKQLKFIAEPRINDDPTNRNPGGTSPEPNL